MAKRNLGQVGFRDRGNYSDAVTYKKWDMVTFEGGTFICNIPENDTLIGISPTTHASKWKCIARGGVDGIDGRNGVVVTVPSSFGFFIRDGDLIVSYPDEGEIPNFRINKDGYLILTIE